MGAHQRDREVADVNQTLQRTEHGPPNPGPPLKEADGRDGRPEQGDDWDQEHGFGKGRHGEREHGCAHGSEQRHRRGQEHGGEQRHRGGQERLRDHDRRHDPKRGECAGASPGRLTSSATSTAAFSSWWTCSIASATCGTAAA